MEIKTNMKKNPSIYDTLIHSPEWKAWYKYAGENHLFDVDETQECDWMSPEHFKAFVEFIKTFLQHGN